MAHHEVRLARYNEFNPNVSKWRDDKRSYERATGALKVLVAKNYATLGIPSVAIFPEISKGKFIGVKFAAPEGPLTNYFEKQETQQIFFRLLQDSFLDALAKKEDLRDGKTVKATTEEQRIVGFSEPPKPVE